ncbi:MAG: tripartite tricarboxylate transporter substrate binding protein [Burkholderiaceae bacterium]|nr:tripartite tricarboxylate transporter substrate binding protein [Burkholderiaceae bacterium]
MNTPRLCAAALFLTAALSTALPASAQAPVPAAVQNYPERPIKLVSPFPPGGPTDVMARLIGGQMARALGQPVIIENRAGAAGAIGADFVAKAAPDGYTLCYCTTGPLVTLPLLDSKLPYQPARDLLPVSQVNRLELVLVARPGLEAQNIPELVALAKARPGRITYAIPGMGGPNHLAVELLKTLASIDLLPVPFKGDQAALTDLMGGHVDLFLGSVQSAAPLVAGGKVKAIAVTGAQRSTMLPGVPTVAESGYPTYEASTFAGIHVPAGTPPAIVAKLQKAAIAAAQDATVRERMLTEGMVSVGNTAPEYTQYILGETAKWEKAMQRAGVKRE